MIIREHNSNEIQKINVESQVKSVCSFHLSRIREKQFRLILFGAGQLGRFTLQCLRKNGIDPLFFVDNNSELWDSEIDGLRIVSPSFAIQNCGRNAIFVITVYTSAPVRKQLSLLGADCISFPELAWVFPEYLIPHGAVDLPQAICDSVADIETTHNLLADDRSKTEFLGQLRWRITLNPDVLPEHDDPSTIYFPDDIYSRINNEHFVDCGAFDGDSIRSFLKQNYAFQHITGIEPDPENYSQLKVFVESLSEQQQKKIDIFQCAAGNYGGVLQFNSTGTAASSVGTGTLSVKSFLLDDLLANSVPTFIKMDIEGAELEALAGAETIIRKHAPVLAICAYHKQEHLWKIPLLINYMNPGYRLYLRRYSDECWELVYYAVPKERLCKEVL